MIYNETELKSLILPILQSMPKGDEDRVADAIVKIIKEDREAHRRR
jgi:hypothetical protein